MVAIHEVMFLYCRYISAGSELTWDYNYEVGSVPGKVLYCYCGSPDCRGRLLWELTHHCDGSCVWWHEITATSSVWELSPTVSPSVSSTDIMKGLRSFCCQEFWKLRSPQRLVLWENRTMQSGVVRTSALGSRELLRLLSLWCQVC